MKLRISAVLGLALTLRESTSALVTGNIKIVGEVGGTQFLPGSYVSTFPRWTAESKEGPPYDETVTLSRLIGSGINRSTETSQTTAHQFVDPTSNEELWWPADLETIQVRPTVEFLLKSAMPTYVLAGLEVRVPSKVSKDGRHWKNFGMNSQPLASQWTSFNIAVETGFRVETYIGKALLENKSKNADGEDEEIVQWSEFGNAAKEPNSSRLDEEERIVESSQGTLRAIEILGNLLASLDEDSPLSEGMHIISIPVSGREWIDLPNPSIKDADDTYKIVSVGTVEDDAKGLLSLDEDMIALSAASVLNVEVSRIAPGGESEYLPQAYVPLYKNI
mmetsp:Transcript_10397/g.15736  ORF Transcript_10397/g.15736 Transcript_10397/m.15736 type:complete len:334 (-) Transcript_10397:15-1016(-)